MTGRGATGLLAILLLSGASPGGCAGDREIAIRSLGGGPQCGGSGAAPAIRRLLGPAEVAAALSPGLGAEQTAPAVNFATEAVLLISTGQRPTAGYGVALGSERAQVKDGVAGIRVAFTAPPAGAVSAQVMTSPCLVVALPREGLQAAAVLDGGGAVGSVKLD